MQPSSPRAARTLAPWALIGLSVLSAGARAPGGDGGSPEERIRPILADAAQQEGSAPAAARRLAALGAAAAPALVGALADGEALSAEQREALLGGLALLDRSAVRAALETRVSSSAAERRAVLAVLERLGAPDDLPLALRAAFPPKEGSQRLDEDLAAASTAILARHPGGARGLPRLVAAAELQAAAALVRGLGGSGRREALDALAALLDAAPDLEQAVLSEIGRLAALLAPPYAGAALRQVRARLESGDPQVVREAALACGRLLDDAALPRLVELLEDPRPGIAEAALFSLRSITSLSLPADRARWQAWLDAEEEWFDTELGSTLARLGSWNRREVLAGLREVSLRRMRRLELAAEVEPLLHAEDAGVCLAACRALAALGACARLASVIDCLEDEDRALSAEAWLALQSLTGAHLPRDPAVWRTSFGETEALVRR